MAIEAFIGLVGGGKSYCSVRRMAEYISRGGRCVSNIELIGWDKVKGDLSDDAPIIDYIREYHSWQYQAGQYKYIAFDDMVDNPEWFKSIPMGVSRTNRTLVVVDEATDLFDNLDRDKVRVNSGYRELFRFLRLSRHAHVDVLFICQDLRSINSRLRGLVSVIYRSTDMKEFRIGTLKVNFPFDVFMLQQFDRRGSMELRRHFIKKDQRIFNSYHSEAFNQDIGIGFDGYQVGDGRIEKKKRVLAC